MYTSKKIFDCLHHALIGEWDPIDVKNTSELQDEYDSYIPKLYQIISKSNSADKIFDYLWWLETDYIGITDSGNACAKKATVEFARKLFKLQQWVEVHQPETNTEELQLQESGYYIIYGNKKIGILSDPKVQDNMQVDFKLQNKIWNPFKRKILYSLPRWSLQINNFESGKKSNIYSKNYVSKFMFQEIKSGQYVDFYISAAYDKEQGITSYCDPLQFKPERILLCGPCLMADEEPPWVMGAEYEPGHIIWRMEYEAWFYYIWKWSFDRLDNDDKIAYLNRWNAPDNWRVFLFEWYYDLPNLISYLTVYPDSEYLFFWGHQSNSEQVGKSCLSQWYEASFTVDNINYPTAEHYMMAEKARLFEDENALKKILATTTAKEAKQYGRLINNFDKKIWEEKRSEIVYAGNWAKFSQNQLLKDFLLQTEDKILVEASPEDTIWGIGLSQDHPDASSPKKWQGLNLLGFILMKIRADI